MGGETKTTTLSADLSNWRHCGVERWKKQNTRGERGGRGERGREGGEHGRAVRGHVFTSTHQGGKRPPRGISNLAIPGWCISARGIKYKPREAGAQKTPPSARRAGLFRETLTPLGGGVRGSSGEETPKSRGENPRSPGPGPSSAPRSSPNSIPGPPLNLTVASTKLGLSPPHIHNPNPTLPPFRSTACWAVSALRANGG